MNIVNFDALKSELILAQSNVNKLKKNLKEIEKMEFEVNHQLENEEKLDACTGYKFAKIIKDIRNKRRILKYQISEQEIICDKLKPFVDSYEEVQKGIETSQTKGKAKYTKNFANINERLSKIKTL